MPKPMTVQQFFKLFPTDDACLEHLMVTKFGGTQLTCDKCERYGRFVKLAKIPAYSCPWCGHHIHPMVGTPFEDSRTPLQKWFYAMYLFTTTRHGVPAKELQRQLSVTYKTAWRMGHQIRKYMGEVDGDTPLAGEVEVDETLIAGSDTNHRGRSKRVKAVVFGMVSRDGDLMTKVVLNEKKETVQPIIAENIEKGSVIISDDHVAYRSVDDLGMLHESVNHSAKEYVRGRTHTNTIEGVWSQLKRSIRGTHVTVSTKHIDKYLSEFEYRYNMRKAPHLMFPLLLEGF